MTPTAAAALVKADNERRVKLAAEAIQRALADYGCDLVAMPTITPDGRVAAVVQIVAK
jgi:formylmethanofuran:tetrahydromethanopterin formyltransferase